MAAPSEGATRTLTAHCFCKAVNYTVTLPTTALPLKVRLCGCNVCRYTHGTLTVFHADLAKNVFPQFIAPSSLANCTGYRHNKGPGGSAASSERYFCSTCGAHIGDVGAADNEWKGQWVIATSLLTEHGPDVAVVSAHCFTKSAYGGGFEGVLKEIAGKEVRVWNPKEGDDGFEDVENEPPKQEFDADGKEVLRAECHCGGVSFTFSRPTKEDMEDPFISRFISPLDKDKWSGSLDLCDDCRLVDGAHVIGWTFIPVKSIKPQLPQGLTPFGTLKVFRSSPQVRRGFCGTCGATIFFDDDDRQPTKKQHVIDVAVGILRSPKDVMATDWLSWRVMKISWQPSGDRYDRDFAQGLSKGFEEWGVKTFGEKTRQWTASIG